MRNFLIIACFALVGCSGPAPDNAFPELTGDYLGQGVPGDRAEIFAPGIVSTGLYTRDLTMTPEGDEIYFCANIGGFSYAAIMVTRLEAGRWTEPEVASFSGDSGVMDIEPFISPDGKRFFFMSTRGDSAQGVEAGNQDIWVMDREGEGWSNPYNLAAPINTELAEYFPSVTRDGSLYFTREGDPASNGMYRSRLKDGVYQEPERLPDSVNAGRARFNGSISPDESFLILPIFGLEDSFGGTDYYIFFRSEEDQWAGPFHLDERVNSEGRQESSASLSPDGKYLFFMSERKVTPPEKLDWQGMKNMHNEPGYGLPCIWWIETSCIEELRP
jgi:hypothetical protein